MKRLICMFVIGMMFTGCTRGVIDEDASYKNCKKVCKEKYNKRCQFDGVFNDHCSGDLE